MSAYVRITALCTVVFQVLITVLDSEGGGIVFIGAPYSFSTVDDVPVNYTINSVTALDQQTGTIDNIIYRIVPDNDTCMLCCTFISFTSTGCPNKRASNLFVTELTTHRWI